jgi:hypothetical protein
LFCDGDLNIMSVEATHVASTNDAGMYASSDIHNAIVNEKRLPQWAHVVLDEAFGLYYYVYRSFFLHLFVYHHFTDDLFSYRCAFTGCTDQELVAWSQSKNHAMSKEKDAFNYFLSKQRQSVERVFGVMVNRFGILWRQMSFSFDRYKLILVALCRFSEFQAFILFISI